MNFVNFLSLILKSKSVDLLKIIEFLNTQVEIQNRMIQDGRKILTKQEKYTLSNLAYSIRYILRLGKIKTVFKPETILKWYTQFAKTKPRWRSLARNKVESPYLDSAIWASTRMYEAMPSLMALKIESQKLVGLKLIPIP